MTGTSPAAALVAGACSRSFRSTDRSHRLKSRAPSRPPPSFPPAGLDLLRTTYASAVTINNPDGPVISAPSGRSPPRHHPRSGNPWPPTPSQTAAASHRPLTRIPTEFRTWLRFSTPVAAIKSPPPPTLGLTANQKSSIQVPHRLRPFQKVGSVRTWATATLGESDALRISKAWEVPVGSLSKTTDANGQTWLIATFPAGQPSCFAQIEIHPPAP